MARRAALARAPVNESAMPLFDEPLGQPDSLTRMTQRDELAALWMRLGFTVLPVTHGIEEAPRHPDEGARDGRRAVSLGRHLPAVLLGRGCGTAAAALVWWGLTFWPTVSNDYLSVAEAGRCLVADSSLCRLATSLSGARHAALVAAYSPAAPWSGAVAGFRGRWAAARRTT